MILGGALGALAGLILPGGSGFWAMLGMAGIMSGAMRAPLTGALFAAELTGRFEALPHTLAAAAGAYAISVLIMRRSILTEKIARRGRHITQEYSVDPLDLHQAMQIMTVDPETLPGSMAARDALAFMAGPARHRSYPVVDGDQRLIGLFSRADALGRRSDDVEPDATLADMVSDASQPCVAPETLAGAIADMILATGTGRVPVIDPTTRKVVGIVTRHDLLKTRQATRADESHRSGRFTLGGVPQP
ncbi:CBS domain-containing protein [Novosphingobium sp.]|uniref:CBS domain-containing protein n=1 Tax=Novosphingobium sp. TaxID=1874826 RepID=UPI003B52CA60